MSKSRIHLSILALFFITTLFSCRKKDGPSTGPTAPGNGSLKVEFSNIVGNEPMVLNDQWYVNAALDTYKISAYKYYVSNVKITRKDGTIYTEPESYHLIDQGDMASRRFTLNNVPPGDYASITFLIGVDEAKNTAGAQTGALAPGLGMFWDWNTGYIMAKMEGTANTAPAASKAFILHIAGFTLGTSVLHEVTLPFPEHAEVSATNVPNVHIFSDANQWFTSPTTISFSEYSLIMRTGRQAMTIADNYKDMFRVDHVDN
jgi:hypothetical protein